MNNIVLGRYVPYNSIIHRMDARNKIISLILLTVAIFISFPGNWVLTFAVGGALAIIVFALLMISHVSLVDIFKSLRVLWFLVIILLVINILVPNKAYMDSKVLFNIGTLPIYLDSILQSLKIILRIVLMLGLTMVLTATTKPLDLTYALEWFMSPLKVIKFPAHIIAMVISIALRFIPTILDETTRIMKAQESRGVDFKHGKLSTRLKAIVSLIIPLFISAFQRSEELADSMEARGYDPNGKRTRYRVLKFRWSDLLTFMVSAILLAGVIVVQKVVHF